MSLSTTFAAPKRPSNRDRTSIAPPSLCRPRLLTLAMPMAILAALSLAAAQPVAAAIERQFDVGAGGTLRVDAESARVDVVGGGQGVEVKISRGRDAAGEIEDDFDIDLDRRGDDVVVEVHRRHRLSFFDWGNRGLVIEVRVPSRYDAEIETSGGSVSVSDLEGDVQAKTSGGSLTFEDIDGPVHARTSGGSVEANGVTGDCDVRTSGGSIEIGDSSGSVYARTSGGRISIDRALGEVTAQTSGGSIDIGEAHGAVNASTSGGSIRAYLAQQPSGDSRLTTSGGSVTVALASNLQVAIDAHTSGGRVHSELSGALEAAHVSKDSFQARLNGGGPQLYLRSSGGSVRVAER